MIKTAIVITLSALIGIVLLCLAAIWLEKKFPGKKFDEMQTISRLKGYRLAFLVGFLYYLISLSILIHQVDSEKTVEPYLIVTIGVLIQLMVVHTYSLLNHAALPLGEKPLAVIGCYCFCGFLQLVNFRNQYESYELMMLLDNKVVIGLEDMGLTGQGSIIWFYLAFGICFFYLALLHTIQYLRREKE